MKRPILKYIGRQYFNDNEWIALWNIYNSPMPHLHPEGSSISIESLRQMGMVR